MMVLIATGKVINKVLTISLWVSPHTNEVPVLKFEKPYHMSDKFKSDFILVL